MEGQSNRRQVDIFNFSFLDILACVIGLLIFVLSIVVVSSSRGSAAQTSAALADAEHRLQVAGKAAALAAARRTQAESLLSERARNVANPRSAADALREEIKLLADETDRLDAATADAAAQLRSIRDRPAPTATIDPATAAAVTAAQAEAARLDRDTVQLTQRAAAAKIAAAKTNTVSYYLPRERISDRRTLWVELLNDRLWCVEGADYTPVAVGVNSNRYDRHPDAPGVRVADLVAGRHVPPQLSGAIPDTTVLQVALHPDGYAAFRVIREWAWAKGFSVNWVPQGNEPIVLTRTEHTTEQ